MSHQYDKIEVARSQTEGLGVFAVGAFAVGDHILDIRYEREITDANPLDAGAGERFEHCAYPDGKIMLVALPGRYLNHSCDPNAYLRYDRPNPSAVARRPIGPGEEITVDYLINNAGGDSWACRCGAERCRGETGISYFDLPAPIREEYEPLLARWFKRRFKDRLRGG